MVVKITIPKQLNEVTDGARITKRKLGTNDNLRPIHPATLLLNRTSFNPHYVKLL